MKRLYHSLIFKIVGLILLIELVALVVLGVMNSLYFTRQIERRFIEQIAVPGRLILNGALRYRSVNDPDVMRQFIGHDLHGALLVGMDRKVYYSLDPQYRDKQIDDLQGLEFADLLRSDLPGVEVRRLKKAFVSITPIRSETGQLLGYLYLKAGSGSIQAENRGVIWRFVWGSLLALGLTVLVGIWAGLRFGRRIGHLTELLQHIAEGEADLTRRIAIETPDELGEIAEHYNRFAEKLREIVEKVRYLVDNLAAAFKEVSVTAEEISKNSEQQSEQMRHLIATIQNLSIDLKEVSRNTELMIEQAQENCRNAAEGKRINEEIKAWMLQVRQNELQFKEDLLKLQANTDEISNVVHLISDLAEQVNILALNAAIEAVKAGEQGKGFSVVAEEVRQLSIQAQESAQEITPLIEKIREQVNGAVQVMQKNLETIQKMTEQVDLSSEKNERIDVSSSKTLEMVEQTGQIYQQTTHAFGAMSDEIQGVSTSSREVATAIRQVTDTIQQLTAGVDELRKLVERFVVQDENRGE